MSLLSSGCGPFTDSICRNREAAPVVSPSTGNAFNADTSIPNMRVYDMIDMRYRTKQYKLKYIRLQNLPALAGFEAPATRRDDTTVAVCTSTERLLYSSLSLLDEQREEDTVHRAVVDGTAVKATVLADNKDAPMSSILFIIIV